MGRKSLAVKIDRELAAYNLKKCVFVCEFCIMEFCHLELELSGCNEEMTRQGLV